MKKLLRLGPAFTLLLLMLLVSSSISVETADKVDKLFAQWDKTDSPGCALAVIKDGKIIYERGYGMANLELNIPITPDSVFYIGSCSKQFVAMCIALLAKKGKLSLDDDIRTYVPEIPDYGVPITIRHLIHHTSGLRDYLTLEDLTGMPLGYFHKDDVIELVSRQKELNFKPGEESLYSNSGYFLLGIIVERVSGKSLRAFAEENIFNPLGMRNSHFHDDYTMIIKNRASGYFPSKKGKYINFISTFDCVGSGGLYTSVRDLFLWDQNFYHKKVGGEDVINLMHKTGILNKGKKLDYAFALSIGEYKGLKTVSHGGALEGYRSYMIRFPEQKFSVICLSNLSTFIPAKFSQQVADIYLSSLFKEERAIPEEKDAFIKVPKKKLEEKVGTYFQSKTEQFIQIFQKKDRLFLEISGQSVPLNAINEMEFKVMEVPTRTIIKFEKQSKGKPWLLHVYKEGEEPETYEARLLVKPTPEQLSEYTGNFFSDELQVTYRLELKEDKLYFVHKNAPNTPLKPMLQDMFTVRDLRIRFIREKEDRISAFSLDAGRVRNIKFYKK